MSRFIYKKLDNGQTVGIDGKEWDAKTETVRVWNASETSHVWTMQRAELVDVVTVNILWFDDTNTLVYAG